MGLGTEEVEARSNIKRGQGWQSRKLATREMTRMKKGAADRELFPCFQGSRKSSAQSFGAINIGFPTVTYRSHIKFIRNILY